MTDDEDVLALADWLRDQRAGVRAIQTASPSIHVELAQLVDRIRFAEETVTKRAIGVEWARDVQRVDEELGPAPDRLRKTLFRVRPLLDHEFEKELPDWRGHIVALHRLVPYLLVHERKGQMVRAKLLR